jgi:DNA-binding PadR family transcriptional regulator
MTELESTVLGVVWLRGPCTAYVVRQEFLASESSYWSGSTGAIYPLLRRLEEAGLIEAAESAWGNTQKKAFSITKTGLAALQEWIGPPFEPWTSAPTFDPIRTRLSFLGALAPAKRRRWVTEALSEAEKALADFEQRLAAFDRKREPFEYLVLLGTGEELRGRVRWLREVETEMKRQSS